MHPGSVARGPRAGQSTLGRIAQSSIGAKWVMAVTGLLFVLWLTLHLVGNLQVFKGWEIYNGYAAFLQNEPVLLWGQRLFVLVTLALHVTAAVRLTSLNRAARGPQGYQHYRYRRATWITRAMPVTGVLLAMFVVFHLAHFTGGKVFPAEFALQDALGRHDIWTIMVLSFNRPAIVAIYVAGMAFLGLHLSHGIWSAMQTFGLNGKRWTPFALGLGRALSAIIAAAFISIPLSILLAIIAR